MSRHAAVLVDEIAFPAPQPFPVRRAPRRHSVPLRPGSVRLSLVPEPAPVAPPRRRSALRRAVRAARSLLHRRPSSGSVPMLLAIAAGLAVTAATLGVGSTFGVVALAAAGTGVCELLDHANRV